MKKVLIGISVSLFCCLQAQAAKQWFEGGTLHKSSLAAWSKASYSNKLATSADFVMTLSRGNFLKFTVLPTSSEMKKYAMPIEKCISEIAKDKKFHSQNTSEIAVMCAVTLKWSK